MADESSSPPRTPDSYRINTREQAEVNYWTRQLGVSREELLSAVRAVGDSEDKVRQHLAGSTDHGNRESQAYPP